MKKKKANIKKKKTRILVIDDQENFTELIKGSLEARGKYQVETQNAAAIAIDVIRDFRPDLILLDIMMADINGDEVAKEIKDSTDINNIPIIFVTGIMTEQEIADRGGIIGGYPFLAKPVKIKELIDTIEKALKG